MCGIMAAQILANFHANVLKNRGNPAAAPVARGTWDGRRALRALLISYMAASAAASSSSAELGETPEAGPGLCPLSLGAARRASGLVKIGTLGMAQGAARERPMLGTGAVSWRRREVHAVVGLIQKVLFDLLGEVGGPAAVAEVGRRAGIPEDRRFRLDAVYPDEEWQRLLAATCEVLGKSQDEVEVIYADYFGRDALRRWPVWFEMSANARQFLERQQTIHNTFATGMRDAGARANINDKFRLEKGERELITHYRSPNQLCGLYKGLAHWVLRHYKEDAHIEETRCTKRGDAECEIHIRWPEPGRAA
jgi:hypothetical protein